MHQFHNNLYCHYPKLITLILNKLALSVSRSFLHFAPTIVVGSNFTVTLTLGRIFGPTTDTEVVLSENE